MIKILLTCFISLIISGAAHASLITSETYTANTVTTYSLTDYSNFDGSFDWFVFDSNGVDPISFKFDRLSNATDLIAALYAGDVTGFDFSGAGASTVAAVGGSAHTYDTTLLRGDLYDDNHCGPACSIASHFGDPSFEQTLKLGTYSLVLWSLDDVPGDYTVEANVSTGGVSVPEPSTLAIFALGMIGLASRRFKKQS